MLSVTVPLDASPEERAAAQRELADLGEAMADTQQAGITVVVGCELTPDGEVFSLRVDE